MRLSEIVDIILGQSPDSATYTVDKNGLPFFQGNADFGSMFPKERVYCSAPIKIAQEGDILLSVRAPIGAVNVANQKCCIGRGLAAIRPKKHLSGTEYLYYLLIACYKKLADSGTGSTFKAINGKTLYELEIPNYSLQEQKNIADKLKRADNLIAERKRQLEKLDLLVKAKFYEMFGGIRDEDKLINLCTFIDYRGKTPEKAETGLPFITAKNVKMHYMSFDTQEFISKETYDKVMTRGFPMVGDVIFTTEAPLGNVCRIPPIESEFYIGQRIITMQSDCIEPAYLEYALSTDSFRKKLGEKASGSTVIGIRSKLLENLTIPVPPLELQNEFSHFVEQTEKIKAKVKQSLEKLELLKQSLLQKYFG